MATGALGVSARNTPAPAALGGVGFDLASRLILDVGAGLSLIYFDQRFETSRLAPPRRTWSSSAELVVGLGYELSPRAYVTLEGALQAYVLPMFTAETRTDDVRAAFAWRTALGAGTRF